MAGIPWFGFSRDVPSGTNPNTIEFDYALNLGCQYCRLQCKIANIAPTADPATWTWGNLDRAMDLIVHYAGMIPIIPLDYGVNANPGFAFTLPSQQATSDPFYYPDPQFTAFFAQQLVQRYNGIFNVPTYGPMTLNRVEMGNEYYNILDSSPYYTPTIKLNQNVTAGQSFSTLAIQNNNSNTAPVGTAINVLTGQSPDAFQLTAPLGSTDTSIQIGSIQDGQLASPGPYTFRRNHSTGEVMYLNSRGLYSSVWPQYNSIYGPSNGLIPQPERAPSLLQQQAMKTIYTAIKNVRPEVMVGSPAVWWGLGTGSQTGWPQSPGNHFAYTAGFSMFAADPIVSYYDYLSLHRYYHNVNPITGGLDSNGQWQDAFPQVLANIDAAFKFNGTPGKPLAITEFGFQVPTNVDENTRNTYYQFMLSNFVQYTRQTGKPNVLIFYTIDANQSTTDQNSLITWVSANTYNTTLTYTNLQAFTLANPSLL